MRKVYPDNDPEQGVKKILLLVGRIMIAPSPNATLLLSNRASLARGKNVVDQCDIGLFVFMILRSMPALANHHHL